MKSNGVPLGKMKLSSVLHKRVQALYKWSKNFAEIYMALFWLGQEQVDTFSNDVIDNQLY